MTTALVPRAPAMAMGTLEDPRELGTVLAASGYFTDARDAAQAVVKVLAGAELGFGPIASMTGVYIVKGRVTLSANLMAAAIKRHPKYDYRVRDLSNDRADVAFFEAGQEVGSSEFTMADAKTAGLASGDNWRKYPRNMLFARALSNGAKFYCPDVFAGAPVYTPDELGADVDPETGEILEALPIAPESPRTPEPAGDAVTSGDAAAARPHADAAPASTKEPSGEAPESAPDPGSAGATNGGPAGAVATAEENAAGALAGPPDDPDTIATTEEVNALSAVLEAYGAPESFSRMALMGVGKNELAELTRGEAYEMLTRANARFRK